MKFDSNWFRKNQKKFLGLFVVVLMAAWGIGPAISMLSRQFGEKPVGTIFGKDISQNEFNDAIRRWSRVFLQQSPTPIGETVWKQLMLVREAERLGIRISDEEVLEGIRMMGARLFGGQINIPVDRIVAILCDSFGVGEAQLLQTIREAFLIEKLDRFIRDSIKVSSEEAWQKYSWQNEQAKVKYIALKAKDIVDYMEINDDEIQSFYNEHCDTFPNTFEGIPGYKELEKVKIEYIMARYDDLKERVSVSEEEVRKYYEDNKNTKYKLESASQESGVKSQDALTQDSGPKTQDSYKPFDEVKEEINNILKRQKAEELAIELVNKVDDQITTELGKTERTSFEELAKKSSLTYNITAYFEKKEAHKIIHGTDKLALMAFEREKYDPTPPFDCSEGRFIFQVVDRKPPGAPPLAEIRNRVEMDLRKEKALRKMRELAEICMEKMKDGNFDEGVKILEAALFEIVKQGPTVARPGNEAQKVTVEHSETDYFSRPIYSGDFLSRYIPALHGDRPNVASKAFGIKKEDVAIVVEERGEKTCYIISLVDKKEADKGKFEEGEDRILKIYLAEKQEAFMIRWIDSLSQKAKLEARYSM
ncbi:MAG TPA: SurA N-terminal domain-containing protein [Candidatus Brocadiia bacterium]|nr:SurA N-terminal domain-containing protein [Planctomycetota bacterium]MDO8093185.1 SurA N-terminal domain-containing protein [Candidatus Brocadiales bacterium]